jgi:hypothetical protein
MLFQARQISAKYSADGSFGHSDVIRNAGKGAFQGFPLNVVYQPLSGPAGLVHIRQRFHEGPLAFLALIPLAQDQQAHPLGMNREVEEQLFTNAKPFQAGEHPTTQGTTCWQFRISDGEAVIFSIFFRREDFPIREVDNIFRVSVKGGCSLYLSRIS